MQLDATAVSTTYPRLPRPPVRLLLAIILIVGLLLRLYGIGQQSLWIDEADIYAKASKPTVAATVGPVFGYPDPPLHQVLLHFWLKLSSSDASARLPSVLFGVATIYLFYHLFAALFTPHVGLLAAALLCINPFHVWYSQEARMYSMLLFFGTLATLLLWKAVANPRARNWVYYALALTICGFTHPVTSFIGIAHAIFVVVVREKRKEVGWRFAGACVAAGVLLLPLGLAWAKGLRAGRIPQMDKPASLFSLAYVFFTQSVGTTFGPSIYEIHTNTSISVAAPYWREVLLALVVFGAPLIIGTAATWRNLSGSEEHVRWLLFPILVVPSLCPFAIDMMSPATLNPRHAIICLMPYVGLLALGISSIGRLRGAAVLTAITVVSAVSLGNLYWNPRYAKEDARAAGAYLSSFNGANAAVLVSGYATPIKHYYKGPMPIFNREVAPRRGKKPLESAVKGVAGDRAELFLVDLRGWHVDPQRQLERTCDRLFRRRSVRSFHGVKVIRYKVPQYLRNAGSRDRGAAAPRPSHPA